MSENTYNLHTGIIILNKDQGFVLINDSAQKILGWSEHELQKNFRDLSKLCSGLDSLAKLISKLLRDEKLPRRSELAIAGQFYNCYLSQDRDQYILELNPITYHDMDEATHELKRPIQNIKTLVETLIMGAKNDQVKLDEYLTKLNSEADRLANLVQDMLSLSRLINGSVDLNKVDVDVALMVDKQIEQASNRAQGKHIKLINSLNKNFILNADKKLLEHALANLIDNAIKYNRDDGTVEVVAEAGNLIIRDSGLGISDDDKSKIFEQFYRIKDRVHIQGSGLGLSLVKSIVDLHGWTIKVESKIGQGTSFVISYQ